MPGLPECRRLLAIPIEVDGHLGLRAVAFERVDVEIGDRPRLRAAGRRDLIGSRPSCHAGSLAASSSTFSILGGELSKVAALAIKAAAIWPFRCAWRPASSAKASNTPNVEGPNFNANQAVVPDSALASGSALGATLAITAGWPHAVIPFVAMLAAGTPRNCCWLPHQPATNSGI